MSRLVLLALLFSSGCASLDLQMEPFDLKKGIPWGAGDANAKQPAKIVVVWTDTVMYTPGKQPVRGFGGRMMFYSNMQGAPLKVDGQLVVYAFDETNRDPDQVAPDRKYVFTADQLPKHYSKSKVGHSYSIWLPWDEAGGAQKEVSLVARFTPVEGSVVVGEQTRHLLPGVPGKKEGELAKASEKPSARNLDGAVVPASAVAASAAAAKSGVATNDATGAVQPAGFVTPAAPITTPAGDERKMQTTTIELPNRFGRTSPEAQLPAQPASQVPAMPAALPAAARPFTPPPMPVPQAYTDRSSGYETSVSYGPPPTANGAPGVPTRPLGNGIQTPGAAAGALNTTVWNGPVNAGLGQGIPALNSAAQPGFAGQTAMRPSQTQPAWANTMTTPAAQPAQAAQPGAGFQPAPAQFPPVRPRAVRPGNQAPF